MRMRMNFENRRDGIFEVVIEPTPDSFNLKPGEKLTLEFDCNDPAEPLNVELHDECLTLWPNAFEVDFTIDGKPANERSWKD